MNGCRGDWDMVAIALLAKAVVKMCDCIFWLYVRVMHVLSWWWLRSSEDGCLNPFENRSYFTL